MEKVGWIYLDWRKKGNFNQDQHNTKANQTWKRSHPSRPAQLLFAGEQFRLPAQPNPVTLFSFSFEKHSFVTRPWQLRGRYGDTPSFSRFIRLSALETDVLIACMFNQFSETLPIDKLKSVFSFLNEIGLKETAQVLFKESKLGKTKLLTGGPITNLNQLFEAQEKKSSVTKKACVEESISSDESSDSESEAEMAVVEAAKPSRRRRRRKEDGNKFLDLSGVPDLLKKQSGLKTYLYLRDCYDDLIKDISSCLSEEVPGRSKTIAILGTEGIGKSALFLVILKSLLKNPSTLGLTTRSFYYQTIS
eukprot:scaffold486_cov168-Ochromonas_danica.AAC.2